MARRGKARFFFEINIFLKGVKNWRIQSNLGESLKIRRRENERKEASIETNLYPL